MLFFSRSLAASVLLTVLLGAGTAETTAPSGAKVPKATEAIDRLASASRARPFPRATDFLPLAPPVSFKSPQYRTVVAEYYSLAKLTVFFVAIFVWLYGVQLCSTQENTEKSRSWTQSLFLMGIAGIMVALLLPAYLPSAVLLLVTSAFPYLGYVQLRKNRIPEPDTFAEQPYFRAVELQGVSQPAEVELLSGEVIGDVNSTIHLVGKSSNLFDMGAGVSPASQSSQAFQHALALIDCAVSSRATDLHINTRAKQIQLRQRIDGTLISLGELPMSLGLSVINVFKVLCDLNIADRRRSQDGSFLAEVNGRRLSFRVSSQGTQSGETLSIRILDPVKTFSDLSSLGMADRIRERFDLQLGRRYGLILIVGATGAGKSTTSCAALQSIDSNTRNVVSIEDPIEYQIPSVDQIEINFRAGQSFASVLRSVLRLDADIIFIGEIRDEETARIACQAAQTGQLVIATMHGNDAVSGALRLSSFGIDAQTIAGTLQAVLAQTLVRKLCESCRVSYVPEASELEELGLTGFEGSFYRSPVNGNCTICDSRGFIRRTGVYELLELTATIRQLICDRKSPSEISAAATENGMTTIREAGLQLVCDGTISVEEFKRVLGVL